MRVITLGSVSTVLDMFDEYTDTQTETADQIQQSFDVSGQNSVVVLNNYGITCNLTVTDDDTSTEYFDETVSLIRDNVADWYDYWFAPVRVGRDVVFYFEEKTNSTAVVTISYSGGTAKCGMCVPGFATDVGNTNYGLKVGINDYSIIDTNSFGLTYLSVGTWAKTVDADINILNAGIDAAQRKFVENIGLAAVFDFNNYDTDIDTGHTSLDKYQALIAYGYFDSFEPDMDSQVISEASVSVVGMI